MRNSFRIFFSLILLALSAYLGLVWAKFIPRPSNLPDDIEPLTFLVTVCGAFLLSIDEVLKFFRLRNMDTFSVKILNAKISSSRSFSNDFKGVRFSNIIDIHFHVENTGNKAVAINDMEISTVFSGETIKFHFARIYQIKPGYPNGITVDPRPGLIEVIEPGANKTMKVRISNNSIEKSLKGELSKPLNFKLKFLNGKEHIEVFYLENDASSPLR